MKAVLHNTENPNQPLKIGEVEKPIPSENEVLVKVKATALNRADLLQRAGKYPPPKGASKILGLELVGEVVEVGKNVTRYKVGDEVFGLVGGGGYAQFAVIDEKMAIPKPSFFSYEQAAAIPEVFLTAFQTISWTFGINEKNSKSILIHAGASGVGSAAIQICKALGMRVFVTASKEKHSFCQSLGADVVIDYQNEDFEKIVLEKTEDKGVNYIIDFIGKDYWNQNINSIATDGKIVLLAAMSGAKLESVNLAKLLMKRVQVTGSTLRSRSLEYQQKLTKEFIEFAMPWFESGELKPVVDKVFDWNFAEKAHQYMQNNQNKGKIILSISE
ncbi:NAD(P)H-quinone oxidoreductase [Bernardetia sp.]|uniref:NAD(P)H-quinone oxidoreductase n=1 Tax=Bernardetia sp. TaxID=1937974 RepID=UPI0025BACA41|nr:NAD(P)H-quinone oxidoreductase [Bernardetia sp.]